MLACRAVATASPTGPTPPTPPAPSIMTAEVHDHIPSLAASSLTKAQEFRNIVPDSNVLRHLDGLKLGYVSRRRARVALSKRQEHEAANPVGYQGKSSRDKDKDSDHHRDRAPHGPVRESRADRDKRRIKSDGKVVDAMPLELGRRPYPFNRPGRAMTRLTRAGDIRGDFSTPEVAVIGRSNVGKSTLINNVRLSLY